MDVVAAASPNIYLQDLVSFGRGILRQGIVIQDATVKNSSLPVDTFEILLIDNSVVYKNARDIRVLDRSHLYPGQVVGSACDITGQIGVVIGVTTLLDLAEVDNRGMATGIIKGVSPSSLRRVRSLNLGDFVVSGPWLGRVVEVSIDVDILFDDGAVCRVNDANSKMLRILDDTDNRYRIQMNCDFYPGLSVTGGNPRSLFKTARWLNGYWNPRRDVGTVLKVDTSGVLVYWIASMHCGTDKELVEASAPPAYQHPDDLTFFCAACICSWGVADHCFFRAPSSTKTNDDNVPPTPTKQNAVIFYRKQMRNVFFKGHRRKRHQQIRRHVEVEFPMTVASTITTVDVLWQDGTLQHGIPSATLVPFGMVNEQEFLPGQHVIENGLSFDTATDTNGEYNDATRRVGIVRSLDCKDQTVCVSWFKAEMCTDEAREVESIDTMSAYDLKLNYSPYYGDIVVRLIQSEVTNSNVDLSWVGRVADLLPDEHVQVRWADGSMSKVSPHEIVVVNEEHYMELWTEMGDWLEDDGIDEEVANTDNDLQNPADYSDVENDDPAKMTTSLLGLVVQSSLPLTGDMVTNRQPPPSSLVPSSEITPEDHHYIDDANKGGSRGKNWAKAVQKEWQILENDLPETIYVQVFEGRMDLLRVVMVGASGTPYHHGLFFFDLQLPSSYPAEPPQVYYHSYGLRLNPNLYESGTVCLSLLNTFDGEGTELWSSVTSSLLQVVVSIQGLVLNDQPYYNEAGYETLVGKPEGRRNALPYNENAYMLSLRTILHVLRRPPQGFEEFVKDHFRRQGRFVLTTCDACLRGCVVGNAHATEASKGQPCSAGLKIALANMLPILVAAFTEIGAQGCEEFKKLYALSTA
nr:probable ubiquitin-conjugating enzyme E2 23 [Lolium perenne]